MTKFSNSENLLMPAEWEKQKSTWIAWPHNKKDWPGKFREIPWIFGKIITELSKVQSVNILVKNKSDQKKASLFLNIFGKIVNYRTHCHTVCRHMDFESIWQD